MDQLDDELIGMISEMLFEGRPQFCSRILVCPVHRRRVSRRLRATLPVRFRVSTVRVPR